MQKLLKSWTPLLSVLVIAAVLIVLLAPGYQLEPSAGRAARAAALTMLSMMMAAQLLFALIASQASVPACEELWYPTAAPLSLVSLRC